MGGPMGQKVCDAYRPNWTEASKSGHLQTKQEHHYFEPAFSKTATFSAVNLRP